MREACNELVCIFINICNDIRFPVALDKTEWASPCLTFLGMLMDGNRLIISIPEDKVQKMQVALRKFQEKRSATVCEIQCLAGLLNFLNRAIVPGRVFTRCMYAKYAHIVHKESELKPHHHVKIDPEFRFDCEMWSNFLKDPLQYSRPFIDFEHFTVTAHQVNFQTDASRGFNKGFGCHFQQHWAFGQWEPSIAYLVICTDSRVTIWAEFFRNQ